jgi:hypothetical protein
MPRWTRVAPLVLAFVSLFSFFSTPALAAFDFNDTTWEGTSDLLDAARAKLGRDRVVIAAALEYDKLKPEDGVLLMAPKTDLLHSEISAFLRAGGRLALVDDFGTGSSLLERFQIHRIRAPANPRDSLRQNRNLAIAVPAVQLVAGIEQGRHPVVAEVDKLVTNHPTALMHPNLTPVLKIAAVGEPDATLAVTGIIVNRGRLFAMGDPSALINLMLRYPGNRAFAEGLIEYLVEDDSWGQRGGKLYVLANDFRQRGQYGGGTTLSEDLLDYVSGATDVLDQVHENGLPALAALLLAVVAAILAVAWIGLNATRPYRRTMPRYAAPISLLAQGGVAGRAAVLAAPTTHRALALLELKSALEERLCRHLGLPPDVGTATIVDQINRQGALSRRSSEELKAMFSELARAETAIAASQPLRVTLPAIESMRKRVMKILREIAQPPGHEP